MRRPSLQFLKKIKLKRPGLIFLLLTQISSDFIGAGIAYLNHKPVSDGSAFGLQVWCMMFALYAVAMQFD